MFKQILRSGCNLNESLPAKLQKVAAVCSNVIQYQDARMLTTANTKKWDLYSAVCLERHPIVTQSMQEIEAKFHNMLKTIEYENSLKSDYELKKEAENKQEKLNKTESVDDINVVMQTMQDIEDIYQEELNNFKFAPRVTKFDEQNITSSLKRKLDKNLLLLVQQKVGDVHYWLPPQGIRKQGETMRQTAERVLQDACGTKIKVKFYGNAPIGFYKYKYPKKLCEQGNYGAKIFYFLAKYTDGDVSNDVKHQWLDHEELKNALPKEIKQSISQFILFP
ncbi:hypothetical protein PUN28_014820 [Cardiocondyla obscurior]|uniref:Large ribosomal subunit protein mL46 n=1 Tax=Cardiocondyla obscurior TaxID=286306 RepID=A0AAW2EVL2_9HYME